MPTDYSSPTASPGPIYKIIPCAGMVVVTRLDDNHDLERRSEGSERIVPVIRIPARTD